MWGSGCMPTTLGPAAPGFRVVPTTTCESCDPPEPSTNRELLVVIAERLREADRRRLEFATKDALGRIATRLLELADRFGEHGDDGVRIDLPLHQEDLASWCGASRESTVRVMRTLRRL